MRKLVVLLSLVVLCIGTVHAETAPTSFSSQSYATIRFDAVKSVTGEIVPVNVKVDDPNDPDEPENIHDITLWKTTTGGKGITITDPTRPTLDPEMLALSLDAQIQVQGKAAVLFGIDAGFYNRPLTGTGSQYAFVWYNLNGVDYKLVYLISWYSPTEAPTVTLVPTTATVS